MVAGTWIVREDLSLVQIELYRGEVQNLTPPWRRGALCAGSCTLGRLFALTDAARPHT